MTTTRRRAPIMFQRRLVFLLACGLAACVAMSLQLLRLTVIEGAEHRTEAQSRLQTKEWIPTWRGSIIDRNGRSLARDEPGYEVAVSWGAITGNWAERKAMSQARREVGPVEWNERSPEAREQLIAEALPRWTSILEELWSLVAQVRRDSPDDIDSVLDSERARVQRMAAVIWERQRQRHEARYGQADDFKAMPIAEQTGKHVVVPHLRDEQAIPLQKFAEQWPELVDVRYARHRSYPIGTLDVPVDRSRLPRSIRSSNDEMLRMESVGDQILGSIRYDVWAEDMKRRPFRGPDGELDLGGYRTSDRIGARGIERGWEDELRGERGVVLTSRQDGQVERQLPLPGNDILLSIDGLLQSRVESILDARTGLTIVQDWHGNDQLPVGTALAAAAVVLDIPTGEIMAMASVPEPSDAKRMTPLEIEERSPWVNRVTEATYPPGSIIKPLVLAAAMMESIVDENSTIECRGHHFPGRDDVARCWIYRPRFGMATHGPLQAREALARSCNCYFYELGSRLGLERMAYWLSWFGIGRPISSGLDGASENIEEAVGGSVLDEVFQETLRENGEASFESIMMSIGQGRITWTPLHAADAYATLARGGRRLPPTLVRGHRGRLDREQFPDREIPPVVVNTILEGMREGVTESWGTGSQIKYGPGDYEPIFNVPGVVVMGKTGTAQSPPWSRDVDGDGLLATGERTSGLEHAWFVGLVGNEEDGQPRFAIAVLVEYGGSGGRVAGPVANQIVHALQSEGYLESAE